MADTPPSHHPALGGLMGMGPFRSLRRSIALAASLLLGLSAPLTTAAAQYFGRNKVQFDRFDFRVLPTEHFDVHFYPAMAVKAADAARMAERWYARHLSLLKMEYSRNPIIFYADAPDFQQTNVIEEFIGQGTGGVTEGLRDRVIMPFTGIYAETDHVLGHELVHVSQYRIAESIRGGFANMNRIPLWLIEGMAEYLSLGRQDPNTAMWLRDALQRDNLPTIRQLTTDPRFFPYRYGQALWAYIGGTWGDDAVNAVFRGALEGGWENSIRVHLRTSTDSLSAAWHRAIRREYGPELTNRTAPDAVGRAVVTGDEGDQNVSPSVSPDGRYVAFFSSRGLFGMDLFIAEVATGKIVRQLTSVTSDPHFDALSFISSAGSWSPDGRQLAVVVYAEGDNEIDVFDTGNGRVTKRIRPPGVGAMNDPAWSPDGQRIAFSGMKGGISDLYVHDLATGRTTQLTDDREAQIQPAWSPDGRTIAFATDAGDATNFQQLTFGPMRLALMDASTGAVRLLPMFERGKHINPQFSSDGSTIFFVSDRDGISDIYRLTLATGEMRRVTRLATGVSGITSLSPTLSVSRGTGALLFTVFDRQGYVIRALEGAEALGVVLAPGVPGGTAGLLPPAEAAATSSLEVVLHNPTIGLPAQAPTDVEPYHGGLHLDYVGGASLGVGFGGVAGTGVVGGVGLGFSDMLGNNVVNAAIQAQGTLKDVGAQAIYLNRSRRLNWGFQGYHIPLLGGFANYQNTIFDVNGQQVPGTIVTQVLQRVFYQHAGMLTQYPLSTTRRFELSGGFERIAFDTQVDSFYVASNGVVLRQVSTGLPSASALSFGTGSLAYVVDYSFFGFTSPVAGGRQRFEVSPSFGSLNYGTLLADYRRYLFAQPFTFALRLMHYGRYGSDAESNRLSPLYVGYPTLVRGYDANTFTLSECSTAPSGQDDCPEFSRLNGSRIAVANLEFRIPLFGTERFGLLSGFLPTEVSPFVDMGVAWTKDESPKLKFDENTTERVPVFSTGVSTRLNLLGAAIVEIFWAKPFQRPGKGSIWGFQLAPGW